MNRAYPIPRIEELLESLSGGKQFSKLDLSHAYLQITLDALSRRLVTINTHKGLFEYTRLPFGIASAPSIFQRRMENLLQGIPRVCVHLDDILVSGIYHRAGTPSQSRASPRTTRIHRNEAETHIWVTKSVWKDSTPPKPK